MHEAGLARAVAATMRERGLGPGQVRLLVRGGHHSPDDFDGAIRAHLAGELQDADAERLEIVHLPFEHLCVSCGRSFDAAGIDEACPTCGGNSLPGILDEQLEVEVP